MPVAKPRGARQRAAALRLAAGLHAALGCCTSRVALAQRSPQARALLHHEQRSQGSGGRATQTSGSAPGAVLASGQGGLPGPQTECRNNTSVRLAPAVCRQVAWDGGVPATAAGRALCMLLSDLYT